MPLGDAENDGEGDARAHGRLRRTLQTLGACNRILLRSTCENRLVAEICSALVETGGFQLAWIGLSQSGAANRLKLTAASGVGAKHITQWGAGWHVDDPAGRDPCWQAMRENRPVITSDIVADLDCEPWQTLASQFGLRSCAAVPLADGGAIYGTLVVCSNLPNAFRTCETIQLKELGENLAFGIAGLRMRPEQGRAKAGSSHNERELLRDRDHLAHAQRVASVGSVELVLSDGRQFWSDELYRILGFEPGSVEPSLETIDRLAHPNDRDALRRAHLRIRAGMAAPSEDFRVIPADGVTRWLRRQTEVLCDASGNLAKSVTTYLDVTDQKAKEDEFLSQQRELEHNREHLEQAQRVGGLGSMEFDLKTGKTYWSEGFYQLIGADPARTVPSDDVVLDATHRDDRNIVRSVIELAQHGKDVPAIEYRITRPDGGILWVRRRQAVIRDADGRPSVVTVTLQDITERKQFETELGEREVQLRESRENLASAQRIGKIGSSVIDIRTGASHWSDELYALLGFDPERGPPDQDQLAAMVHPDDREEFVRQRERWYSGLGVEPREFRIIFANGETRWFHVQADSISGAGPMPTKVIAILQDITDRKRALDEHAALERQLMQAQKMEAVGNLTGGVAHDFNNLLTVILGHLDLIEGRVENDADMHAWIRVCKNAVGRGARLTRSMLAFARQQPLRPIPIDAGGVIQETCDILGRTLGEGIAISIERAAGLWICEADPNQLQNALLNLAINARDAMPSGGRLLFEARNVSLDQAYTTNRTWVAPGDYVALSVTDTGTGIAQAVLNRVFEPFFTTKETGKGSGLGLSMVYGFVKQSGGCINIYSEVGKGTAVKMYLPRSRSGVAAEPPRDRAKLALGGTEKILVVEDDEDMRALTVTVLRRLGYMVVAAGNAEAASHVLECDPDVALLLTDITLPNGIDGWTLAKRERARRPSLRVLYMSGYSEHAVMHDRRLDPTIRLLEKPFNTEELARQVRTALASQAKSS